MPALDRNFKDSCENCGTLVTKKNLSRHKLRCSGGALYCPKCLNFFTKSGDDLNYHIAKQHSAAGLSKAYKCTLCHAEFPGFYALRLHKNTQHGKQIGFGASNIDVEDIVGDVDDQCLREELESCRHFLVDSAKQEGRHSVFNFAVNNLTAQVIEEKLNRVLDKLKCVAKLNLALGFILKNIEEGKFRFSMLMRTTPCWNSQNLWVTKTTWQNWNRFCRKQTWLNHAQKKGPIRSEGFLN